ncbi:MAG: SAM-dependent methyltransferase [Ornithinimicrobium sp.]
MAQPVVAWHEAWQEALYSPRGFYRAGGATDLPFSTSVHGVPHAALVMARALSVLADRHDLSTLIDVGAHLGQLGTALRQVGSPLAYIGVDVNPRPRQMADIDEWVRSPGGPQLPDDLRGMRDVLVVAQEWLDVVPAVVASRGPAGGWHEVWVEARTGQSRPGPPVAAEDRQWLARWVGPEVSMAEVGRSRDDALRDLVDRVEHGMVVVIDYGHHRHTRPPQGSLRGYSEGRQLAPVPDGSMDLTADVAIDSLMSAAGPWPRWALTQRAALGDLLGPAQAPDYCLASQDPQAYLDGLAESGARHGLQAPEAFGGFWWVYVDRTQ